MSIAYVGGRLPALSETFVYRELLGLRKRGHRMTVVSVHSPDLLQDRELQALAHEAIVVYSLKTGLNLPMALVLKPGLALKALREAATADLDGLPARAKYAAQAWLGLATARRLRRRGILHVHSHLANVPATVGLHLARALGARFSFTGHAADLFVYRGALALKLREAAFVAAISGWHRDHYRSLEPEVAAPVIRCGVALPDRQFRENGCDLVLVARLVAKKGVDLLLRAVAQIDDPTLRVRIAGDGPQRAQLEQLAYQLGIADQVEFLGAQPHETCLDIIRRSALFVLPCRSTASGDRDGIPVVLMEAMAAGRPVIAGELPAITELVQHGINGLLVSPGDPGALAAAIKRLIRDPALRLRLGSKARQWVAAEFSDGINLDRLERAMAAAARPTAD